MKHNGDRKAKAQNRTFPALMICEDQGRKSSGISRLLDERQERTRSYKGEAGSDTDEKGDRSVLGSPVGRGVDVQQVEDDSVLRERKEKERKQQRSDVSRQQTYLDHVVYSCERAHRDAR
jgi:hypothetical protein